MEGQPTRRLYLQGGFSDRTTTGEQLLGYVLMVSITNAAGHILAESEIDSSWAGYDFDTRTTVSCSRSAPRRQLFQQPHLVSEGKGPLAL